MPRIFVPLVILVSLAAAACTGGSTARTSRNLVGGHPASGDLVLNIEQRGEGDSARYELFVRWTSVQRLNIEPGPSLTVTADRQHFVFTADQKDVYRDSNCDGGGPCLYDDRAYYPATVEQIRSIADANYVAVEVKGSRRTIDREFTDTNFETFRAFVAEHLPPAPHSGMR